jgi:drug/metabolite transporter (DMT)-like permease
MISERLISEMVLMFFIVVVGTTGEMFVTRAMKQIGEVKKFTPRALLQTAERAFKVGWMWIGLVMMALAYFALLGMLARANVSFVIPVTSMSYIVGAIGGRWFLGEEVTRHGWAGVLLVGVGVVIIYLGG